MIIKSEDHYLISSDFRKDKKKVVCILECACGCKCKGEGRTKTSAYFNAEKEINSHIRERKELDSNLSSVEDSVNHPSHYGGDNPLEVIKVLKHYQTRDEFIGAMNFNIVKYTLRWRKKGNEEDLKKANFYSNYLIQYLKDNPLDA